MLLGSCSWTKERGDRGRDREGPNRGDRARELKNRTARRKTVTSWFPGENGEIGDEGCLDV